MSGLELCGDFRLWNRSRASVLLEIWQEVFKSERLTVPSPSWSSQIYAFSIICFNFSFISIINLGGEAAGFGVEELEWVEAIRYSWEIWGRLWVWDRVFIDRGFCKVILVIEFNQ